MLCVSIPESYIYAGLGNRVHIAYISYQEACYPHHTAHTMVSTLKQVKTCQKKLKIILQLFIYNTNRNMHRRSLKTEENAKVVTSVWGEEFIQFLVALAVLPRTILNIRMTCTRMILKKKMTSSYFAVSSVLILLIWEHVSVSNLDNIATN